MLLRSSPIMIEFCLSSLFSNEIVGSFFSFVKVVKNEWHSKLSEENINAFLCRKVEGPKIEKFVKEDSSYAAMFWWNAKERRKGRNGKQKKYKKRSRKTK